MTSKLDHLWSEALMLDKIDTQEALDGAFFPIIASITANVEATVESSPLSN